MARWAPHDWEVLGRSTDGHLVAHKQVDGGRDPRKRRSCFARLDPERGIFDWEVAFTLADAPASSAS